MSQADVVAPSSPGVRGVSVQWAFRFAAAVTVAVFFFGFFAPNFLVNSWTHLELSRTIFTDFYRLNTIRNYDSTSPYSQAFPPLWSTVLAIVRRVADLGIYTGYVLNLPICLCLLAALMLLFRRIGLPEWAGAACYLSVLAFAPFQIEALGSRPMPLALALLAGALAILFREQMRLSGVALAGLLMGLACLTRFDALALACAIGVAFAARAWSVERRLPRAATVGAIYFLVVGAALSPMIAYGETHFGKLFPSDNTRMVLAADSGGVTDYYKTPPPPDLFQHPGRWVAGLFLRKIPKLVFLGILALHPAEGNPVLLLLPPIIALLWRAPQLSSTARRFIFLALLLIPVILLPATAGGIVDSRYYAGPAMLLFAVMFILLLSVTQDAWNARRTGLLLFTLALPLYPIFLRPVVLFRFAHFSLKAVLTPLSPTPRMQRLTEAVHRDSAGGPHRLMITDSLISAAKYGALTGEPVAMIPALVGGTFADFARDWHITHLYTGPIERAIWESGERSETDIVEKVRAAGVQMVPLDLPGLYRIEVPPPHSDHASLPAVVGRPESPPVAGEGAPGGRDYWMYIGTDTASFEPRDSQGIYVCKFHSQNGQVDPARIAADRLPQLFAPLRARWPITATLLRGVQNPRFITIHPNGRYLYTADANKVGTVSAYQVDPHTGMLSLLNVKPAYGSETDFVTVDRTGRDLLAANYGGSVAVFPIGPDGHLRDATSVMEHHESGAERSIQAHAHSVSLSPDNRFAVATDTGLDEVLIYRFDASKGVLTPGDPPFLRTAQGMAPRHLYFHPNGVFAYVIGERGARVAALRWNPQGSFSLVETVSALPAGDKTVASGTEVMVDESGRFLYASVRGSDAITVFAIDPSSGTLAPFQYEPSRGQMPRNFSIAPGGRRLFVANAFTYRVVEFQIDSRNGRLTPTGFSLKVPSPHCIAFAPAT